MTIQINSNIAEYKPTVMAGFTGTQLICIAIAGVIEMVGAFIVRMLIPMSVVTFIIPLPLAIIPIILGWAEDILHMPLRDYWSLIVMRRLKYPKFRPYAIHNYIETLEHKIHLEDQQAQEAQNKKETKENKKKPVDVQIPPELKAYT